MRAAIGNAHIWRALVAATALLAILTLSTPADAAIRRCYNLIVSEASARTTELDARRAAMSDWVAEARRYGEGFVAWRLAIDRDISCSVAADGEFRCRVAGRPCTIDQVP